MGRKQTKLVKSQPLLVERHHKLWIPRAASGLSLLGLSPWTCRARATLLSWSLGCPPLSSLSLAPRGAARPGAAGTARRSTPRDAPAAETTPPSRPSTGSPLFPGTPAGTPGAGLGAQVPAGPGRVEDARAPRAGGRTGRVKAAQPWRPSWAAWRGPQGQRATSVPERERERVRGEEGRHTQDAHLARLCSGARSQEAEVKVKRCGGAAAPFARPDSLQEPRAGPAAPPCPLSLLEQMCGDPC